jgi:hypothetical protein
MAGEHQADTTPGCERNNPRIVCEQNGSRLARDSADRTLHISTVAIIVNAGNIKGGSAKMYCNMLIPEDFDMSAS